jgi:sugar/nucleoside kinase (ribokinase family)
MSLVVVGSIALDSLETPSGRRDEVLGGAASYFCTCAAFFGPVRPVAVVGDDFPAEHLAFLSSRGVDVEGVVRRAGRTFRWKGRYESDLNVAHTLETQLNVFADFRPDLPRAARDSEYVFLGNIDPDLQQEVLGQVRAPRLVGLDSMNYWIQRKKESLLRALERVDIAFVNEAEARQLAEEPSVVRAARRILEMGPSAVVVKRGECGALLFSHGAVFAAAAMPLASVVDPTGAGDSFAGGFMGHLARARREDEASLRRATVLGGVLASFAVEGFSLDRLRTLTAAEIRGRYAEARKLVQFPDLDEGALAATSS